MESDLEIVKACARAMGIDLRDTDDGPTVFIDGLANGSRYDPLHDDAQAMALVRKFGLTVYHDLLRPETPWDVEYEVLREGPDGERYPIKPICQATDADLNRAICLCVAAMQAVPA